MSDPHFFGYGSLVNTATHAYPGAARARVTGWRRAWRHTDLRPVAFLTAEPAPGSAIDGLIARVPGADWAALDEREAGYDRHLVTHLTEHGTEAGDIALYAIPEGRHVAPSEAHPVLQSYLDVVLQGYLQVFGEAGLRHFIETTEGWDVPLLLDRAAPVYPRAQTLTPSQRRLIDRALDALPLRRRAPRA